MDIHRLSERKGKEGVPPEPNGAKVESPSDVLVDADTGEIVNRRFSRAELIEFLSKSSEGRVALEACGNGHWWARKIRALGHEAVLLHAKFIRPFVQTNKTDAADARAIWTAVQQPGMRTVTVKSEEQQAVLGLHRVRTQLTKSRDDADLSAAAASSA